MSKLDNFKGKSYTLTLEDRRKGGRVSSKKKALANGLKNLKHGKNSSNHILLLRCSDCPYVFKCSRMHDGFCSYLLDDLKHDLRFFKHVNKHLKYGLDSDTLFVVREKYRMNKLFAQMLEDIAIQESSDSNG
jgi:hypothetical protein